MTLGQIGSLFVQKQLHLEKEKNQQVEQEFYEQKESIITWFNKNQIYLRN